MSLYRGSQLAADYTKWPDGHDRLLVEPKLDGYRLSAVIDHDGEVSFRCRGDEVPGWAENLDHIADDLRALAREHSAELAGCMLDGELQAATWNATSSLVRRKRALASDEDKARMAAELKFHAFDWVPLDTTRDITLPRRRKATTVVDVPTTARREMLAWLLRESPLASVRLVSQFEVRSEPELFELFDELQDMEFEGAMAKLPDAPYGLDRTPFWLKLKPWKTVEMTIAGAQVGEGKIAGMLGAFHCRDAKGNEVSVGSGFTDEQRREYWHLFNLGELHGERIEVKVQGGKVATARHPVFLRFRPQESDKSA